MRRWTFGVVILAGVTVLGSLAVELSAADLPAGKIRWQTDLHAAHRISLQQNKPMLLVLSADWCRYCRKLQKNTLSKPQIVDYVNASFVPVYLDFDKHKRVAKILGVRSIPASIILSPRADLLGRIVGHAEPAKYDTALRAARRLQDRIEQVGFTGQSGTP